MRRAVDYSPDPARVTLARTDTSRADACESVTPRQTRLARREPPVTAGPARRLRPGYGHGALPLRLALRGTS